MPKQIFGQLNTDMKDFIRLKKKKEIYEIRKKLLKKNLKKKKSTKQSRLDDGSFRQVDKKNV